MDEEMEVERPVLDIEEEDDSRVTENGSSAAMDGTQDFIEVMTSLGLGFDDLDENGDVPSRFAVPEVMFGTRCWKCYIPKIFFTCQKCGRGYHRQCSLMYEGFPPPVFDKPLQVAMMEETATTMLMCSECVVGEKTRIPNLVNVPQSTLNSALIRLTRDIRDVFRIKPNQKSKKQKECVAAINCYDAILTKAHCNGYKSVEEYFCEFKQVRYKIVEKFGAHSEQCEVVESFIKVVKDQLNKLLSCSTCYIRRIKDVSGNEKGKPELPSVLKRVIKETCETPHLLCWVKMQQYPYWPSKILGMDLDGKIALIVSFDENRHWNIRLDAKNTTIKVYSKEFPTLRPEGNTSWNYAMKDCEDYINNAVQKFGKVVIPEVAVDYDGNMEKALKEMFPTFDFGKVASRNGVEDTTYSKTLSPT
ncbi:unnamed protein product [Orchesella dallaii]|uniref:PWWP domain-containing protein n=1 Tax=Orchesella dallaii TaxID=48710 RepID=A0ABP1S3K0_9HEXA